MKGLILAAGQGTRLRPLTNHIPKCLVEVHGKSLMQHQLESLARAEIHDCIVVVGYMGEMVQRKFGSQFGKVRITYVTNDVFESTNNIYSMWLACQNLDTDVLLIEGDLMFEHGLLKDLASSPYQNVAVVDRFNSSMNGTVILEQGGLSKVVVLKSQQSADFDYRNALKTVNIYSICHETMIRHLLPMLNRYIDQNLTSEFYEAAFSNLVNDGSMELGIHRIGKRKWAEVDTKEDLLHAENLFQDYSPVHYANTRKRELKQLPVKHSTGIRNQ